MNTANLTANALNTIASYKTNEIIMDFVTTEAREKVASEIRAKLGGGTTAKGVELIEAGNKNIRARVLNYIDLGLIGCFMASLEVAA